MRRAANALILWVLVMMFSTVAVQDANAAVTLSGTVPGGGSVVVLQANNQDGVTGVLKFKFSAGAPSGTSLRFCIGPLSAPCGSNAVYIVNVPIGQERLAIIGAGAFRNNVLWVGSPNFHTSVYRDC